MPLAVCATPIGNLDDVTLRVLRELAEADVVLCEDTRHTRGLLERHGIRARLLSYHEHNEAKRTAELLPRLEAGERVALVSDAGLPGINDPGARLVAAALEAGVPVTVLPGRLGGRDGARRQRARRPSGTSSSATCRAASARCGARRGARSLALAGGGVRVAAAAAALARGPRARGPRAAGSGLPRADEAVRGGRARDVAELAERFAEPPKGEVTLVLGPAPVEPCERGRGRSGGRRARRGRASPRRQAADVVARLTGVAAEPALPLARCKLI